jgi:hypothetical protein
MRSRPILLVNVIAFLGLVTCHDAAPSDNSAGCASHGDKWQSVSEGACYIKTAVAIEDAQYSVEGFRFDLNFYEVELVDAVGFFQNRSGDTPPGLAGRSSRNRSLSERHDFSASEVFGALASKTAVVAGIGYPRFPGDAVLRGLLRVRGRTINALADGATDKRYLTAILCFDTRENEGSHAMVSAPVLAYPDESTSYAGCRNAIQVGPRVIEKTEEAGVGRLQGQDEDRLTFSMGNDFRVYLLYWSDAPLWAVQKALLGGELGKGSVPRWAANISLRELAGIRAHEVQAGGATTTNAAFLIFEKKRVVPAAKRARDVGGPQP